MGDSLYARPVIDAREAIAFVSVYTKRDKKDGSATQHARGIIINNENLNHSCCPKCTCCSPYRDLLLLPLCNVYGKTKIDRISANVYCPSSRGNVTLDVSEPDKIIQKYNHQLIPCNRKDDKNKKSVNKKKDDKSKKSVKSVSAQILTRDELLTCVRYSPKKLFAVKRCGGRQTFVQLRVVDENNTGQIKFEKSQSDEILSTYGPLVLGIRKQRGNDTKSYEYDVDAIGSYSLEDSGIIITLFGDGNDKAVQFPEETLEQDNNDATGSSVSPQEDLQGSNPYDFLKRTHSTVSNKIEKPGRRGSLPPLKKERHDAGEADYRDGVTKPAEYSHFLTQEDERIQVLLNDIQILEEKVRDKVDLVDTKDELLQHKRKEVKSLKDYADRLQKVLDEISDDLSYILEGAGKTIDIEEVKSLKKRLEQRAYNVIERSSSLNCEDGHKQPPKQPSKDGTPNEL